MEYGRCHNRIKLQSLHGRTMVVTSSTASSRVFHSRNYAESVLTHTAEANYSATEGELLAQADALQKNKYFTLGCPQLNLGTDHMPLLCLIANRNLDSIDNPCLVRLKTLGWRFLVAYIPGKMLGITDALSRYGVRHCQDAARNWSERSACASGQHLGGHYFR